MTPWAAPLQGTHARQVHGTLPSLLAFAARSEARKPWPCSGRRESVAGAYRLDPSPEQGLCFPLPRLLAGGPVLTGTADRTQAEEQPHTVHIESVNSYSLAPQGLRAGYDATCFRYIPTIDGFRRLALSSARSRLALLPPRNSSRASGQSPAPLTERGTTRGILRSSSGPIDLARTFPDRDPWIGLNASLFAARRWRRERR
jgi:hypothetical protein